MKWGEKHGAGSARWALWDRQFDLVRVEDGVTYLTRWWLVKTPFGGLALHRMTGPDARSTLHDHPFSFVSFPIVGGYIERRLDPKSRQQVDRVYGTRRWLRRVATLSQDTFVPRRSNTVRAGLDAHVIVGLLRVPTYTLLLIGPHRGTWGFLEADDYRSGDPSRNGYGAARWRWTRHDAFDSGHYAPEKGRRR